MCGINGIFYLAGNPSLSPSRLIENMNRRIAHRGPDDHGSWSDPSGRVHFGHLRLSILDLTPGGHQPMISDNGTVIVYNGEIYNYRELQQRFFPGKKMKSTSDTEILLLLYERFGEDFLQYLNGMFAFAIWDPAKEKLFLARDRAGKKPLYYTLQNGIFAFSSEIKALLELPFVAREADDTSLYHFLTFNLVPSPLTFFKNIYKVPPSTKLSVSTNGITGQTQYWDVTYDDFQGKDESFLMDEIYNGLSKAVSYRMVSDVPVGAFLSGGVDSSAIVALMTQRSSYPIKTYSIGFEGQPDYDELKFASKISKKFGTDHYETIIKPSDVEDFLPRVVEIFDEPMADATCIPIYFLSAIAKEKGTSVVLTGDGSDELFAGYNNWMKYIQRYPAYSAYTKLPAFAKKAIASTYGLINKTNPAFEILQRAALDQEFFWGGAKSFKESTKRRFLSDSFNLRTNGLNSYSVIRELKSDFETAAKNKKTKSIIDWMCFHGARFSVPNFYLYRMDRLGMAHSVEVRTPFLDYEFMNLALSIPGELKVKNGVPKYILKRSLERILDPETLYRKKQGFNVPLKEWAGDILLDYVEQNLKSFCANHSQFNYEGLNHQVKQLKKGNADVTNTLWTIYFLMAWFKKWMD